MNRKHIYTFLCTFTLLIFSCNNRSVDYLFSKICSINDSESVISMELNPNGVDKNYKAIIEQGTKNNDFLIEKVLSTKPTNIEKSSFAALKLQEGDVAISLLCDINQIYDDNFWKLFPPELLQSEHFTSSGYVHIMQSMHNDPNIRNYVKTKFEELLN